MNAEEDTVRRPRFRSPKELNQLETSKLVSIIQEFQTYIDPNLAAKVLRNRKKRKDRPLNWDKFSLRHVAFKVAYCGWNYQGLATQKTIDNTIESKLIEAFQQCKLIEDVKECKWSRSGRTDKGVSAFSQVIALYVRSNVKEGVGVVRTGSLVADNNEEHDYIKMLNGVLPDDIRVLGWAPVDTSFSARFSAQNRTYKYYFLKEDMDIGLMREAAKKLIGEHDYRNFCKMDVESVSHFTRRIYNITIEPMGRSAMSSDPLFDEWSDMYEITILGSAFLWHQVRCMVSVLFMVGKGEEEPSIVSQLLDIHHFTTKPVYLMASEIPLILYECGYPDLEIKADFKSIAYLFRHFFEFWKGYTIRTKTVETLMSLVGKEFEKHPQSETESLWTASKAFQIVPNGQSKTHIPLKDRPTESSYDERMERLRENKRQKTEETGDMVV